MSGARYQVFVSSTYTDLIDERQAVMSGLLQLGAMPAGMELFPAADEEAWSLIERVIDESDYYLLIIGGRYGSVTEEGVSFTEKEYNYAISQRKPVMAFLHANPELIPVGKSETGDKARERLVAFTSKVKKAKHVKMWNSADDLAGKVALSFGSFTQNYPTVGWVRGDAGDSPETLQRLGSSQARVAQLEAELGSQALSAPEGSAGLADYDEPFELSLVAKVRLLNLIPKSKYSRDQDENFQSSVTWSKLLFELGPLMRNEANERQLRDRFDSAITMLCSEDAQSQSKDWFTDVEPEEIAPQGEAVEGEPSLFTRVTNVSTSDSDYETALLQLEALGLIAQGDRKRPVSDRSTYWKLTPWGQTRLRQLRAIPTGARRPTPDGNASAIEDSGGTPMPSEASSD